MLPCLEAVYSNSIHIPLAQTQSQNFQVTWSLAGWQLPSNTLCVGGEQEYSMVRHLSQEF